MFMVLGRLREGTVLDSKGEILEEVDSLKYLGSIVSKNGDVVEDVIVEGKKG